MTDKHGWMDQAACQDHHPDVFYPPTRGHTFQEARTVCAACPVRLECLNYALNFERHSGLTDRAGMYGGMTPEERHGMNRVGDKILACCRICDQWFTTAQRSALYCSKPCMREGRKRRETENPELRERRLARCYAAKEQKRAAEKAGRLEATA